MFDRVGVVLAIVLSLSTLTINILAIIEKLAAIRNKTSHRQQRKSVYESETGQGTTDVHAYNTAG